MGRTRDPTSVQKGTVKKRPAPFRGPVSLPCQRLWLSRLLPVRSLPSAARDRVRVGCATVGIPRELGLERVTPTGLVEPEVVAPTRGRRRLVDQSPVPVERDQPATGPAHV